MLILLPIKIFDWIKYFHFKLNAFTSGVSPVKQFKIQYLSQQLLVIKSMLSVLEIT